MPIRPGDHVIEPKLDPVMRNGRIYAGSIRTLDFCSLSRPSIDEDAYTSVQSVF